MRPFFISAGAITNYQPIVMRRRLQTTRRHTDCTDRKIFGRRNRYASAVQTVTGTPVVDNESVLRAPKSGNGGSVLVAVFDLGAEQMNSSRRSCVSCIFLGGSAPVFESNDRIIVYNYPSLSTQRGLAAPNCATECKLSFGQISFFRFIVQFKRNCGPFAISRDQPICLLHRTIRCGGAK